FESAGDSTARWRRTVTRRNVATLLVCVVVGASSPYYAVAAVLLLAIAALISSVAQHSLRQALKSLALAALILGTFAASAAPAISYRLDHGVNHVAGKRSAFETELYGLKVTDLVLPLDDDRLLERVELHADAAAPRVEPSFRPRGVLLVARGRLLARCAQTPLARDPTPIRLPGRPGPDRDARSARPDECGLHSAVQGHP